MSIRRPAVAGTFYEGTETALKSQISPFINEKDPKQKALGVMAPHAGYMYSGSVAGAVYSKIKPADTFLILGPNHTGLGAEVSIFPEGAWEFPMGEVPIDERLAKALLEGSNDFTKDDLAHLSEHSIEVQVPFLQYLFNNFKIVPVCLGRLDLPMCLKLGEAIAKVLESRSGTTVMVASSDMSHYVSREVAEKKDQLAIEAIKERDPGKLYEVVRKNNISMCGVIPTVVMLAACNAMGATNASLVKYSTSGDVTGDLRQVVGYAGVVVR